MKIAENSNSNKIIKNSADEVSKGHNSSVFAKTGGITLIALVITIIVLLILAGVSLSAVLGENGILSRAEEAEKTQNITRIQEKLELLKGQILLDGKKVNLDNFLSALEEKKEEYEVKYIDRVDSNNAYVVIEEEYKFHIKDTENGDVEITTEGNVGELTLSETTGEFKYPEIKTFTVTKNASGGKLTVSSSKEEIAKATINGNEVTVESGLTEGTAIITVTSEATEEYGENKVKYTAKVGNGDLEVTAEPYSGEYDGNAYGITVTCLTSDVTIEYSSDGETYSTTNPTYTNIGTYTTYYKVSKLGYKTVEGSATVTITDGTEPNDASFVMTGNTTQTTLPVTITAQVIQTDSQSGIDIKNSKWILNTKADKLGKNPEDYTGGTFESEDENINLSIETAGTYYLHILTMDNNGNAKETIKGPIVVTANTHKHTGSTSGGGCYTKAVYHTHTDSCYGSTTYGVWKYKGTHIDGNGDTRYDTYCNLCNAYEQPYSNSLDGSIHCSRKSLTCSTSTTTPISYQLNCNKENTVESYTVSY